MPPDTPIVAGIANVLYRLITGLNDVIYRALVAAFMVIYDLAVALGTMFLEAFGVSLIIPFVALILQVIRWSLNLGNYLKIIFF